MKYLSIVSSAMVLAAFGVVSLAQQPSTDGAFTQAQAERGKAAYERNCVECHLATLRGTAHGPALTGVGFMSVWETRTTSDLFVYINAGMPPGGGGTLGDDDYVAIVAYILQTNGRAEGSAALRVDSALTIGADGSPGAMPASSPPSQTQFQRQPSEAQGANAILSMPTVFHARTVENYRPVTEAMLHDPPAEDWLSWRRTLDGHGYSPLDQITTDNVYQLRLAWAFAMQDNGSNQTTPLVHDGVMYLVNPGNVVQALDAATGEVIWEYRYQYPV